MIEASVTSPGPSLVIEPGRLLRPTIDLYSAWITTGWAGLLLFEPEVYATAPSFAALRALASPVTWGVLLAILALLQFLGVIIRKPPFRFIGQTLGAAWWTFCATAFVASGVSVRTGVVCYATLSLFLLLGTLRPERV